MSGWVGLEGEQRLSIGSPKDVGPIAYRPSSSYEEGQS